MKLLLATCAPTALVAPTYSDEAFDKQRVAMVEQWRSFQSEPKANVGKSVTWTFKVNAVYKPSKPDAQGEYQIIDGALDKFFGRCKVQVVARTFANPEKPVKEKDWVTVEATFEREERGVLFLNKGRVTNNGYKGEGDSPK